MWISSLQDIHIFEAKRLQMLTFAVQPIAHGEPGNKA